MLDDRFGFATHFQQGWNPSIIPEIVATGVGWIRDNLCPNTNWMSAAHQAGLKIVGILDGYGYDPVAMSAAAVGWAECGLVDVIEVLNEPNNAYAHARGVTWQADLVALTNAIADAVHLSGSTVPVIGLGAQGTQILNMLASGSRIDGVAYHPYQQTNCPETVWEPGWYDYEKWIGALASKSTLPRWETEWGIGINAAFSESNQANFIGRRLLQAAGLGIEHTFIYEFKDNGPEPYGVISGSLVKRQAYDVVTRIIAALQGVTASGAILTAIPDLKVYAFQGDHTVIAYWLGSRDPRNSPLATTCELSFPVPHGHHGSYVLNALTGTQAALGGYPWGDRVNHVFRVSGLPLDDNPRLIVLPHA